MKNKPPQLTQGEHALLHAPTDAAIEDLARRLKRANSGGMAVLNLIGGSADGLFARLPAPVRGRMEEATMMALEAALDGASRSRAAGYAGSNAWLSRGLASALGAAGGAGGLPSAMAELPVTTVVLLHTIQSVAEAHGFDTTREDVRKACIQTFAAAGPLSDDDGADLAFLTARTTLTGATLHAILARVAPRLSLVLGQKLAAQAVPVLGAAAGAATNYVYTGYYQDVAHVTFGMLRMAEDSDESYDTLKLRLQDKMRAL